MSINIFDLGNDQPWAAGDVPCRRAPAELTPRERGDYFDQWHPSDAVAEKFAAKLCAPCAARQDCLTWALTADHPQYGHPGGILGGTTEAQRARMRKVDAA